MEIIVGTFLVPPKGALLLVQLLIFAHVVIPLVISVHFHSRGTSVHTVRDIHFPFPYAKLVKD